MLMSNLTDDIKAGMKAVGSEWKRAKKNESNRDDRVTHYRMSRMRYTVHETTIKEAAFQFMREAYNKASSNGKYYANARQIMYAARPLIINAIGPGKWDNDKSPVYFQTLLKDYIEDYDGTMKVVWDARGHLKEPHTKYEIGLGGADVMQYRTEQIGDQVNEAESIQFDKKIKTKGPTNRFGAVLFIEKEGFYEQLEDAGLLEKWDIAIMSSKGIPNAATCNVGSQIKVPILALHDFDLAGFKIVKTLRYGARLSSGIGSNLIDIGLRLEDVEGIDSEPVEYRQREDPKRYLRSCGATEEECNYLVSSGHYGNWDGQRVEINMLTTEELIEFLERKFTEQGIKKVVPDEETLRKAYRRAVFCKTLEEKAEEIEIEQEDIGIPDGLMQTISDKLAEDPSQSWDEALWELADKENDGNNDE
jgi:hypothetical protein